MNSNEIIEQIAEIVMNRPELKASMDALMNGVPQAEEATVQKPEMMYVLTQKTKVHADDGAEIYHYHPVVGETLLFPGCTCNRIVSSSDLLELQNATKGMCYYYGKDLYQILALKTEEFERLQKILDETVTGIIENTHRAVDAFMKNAEYLGLKSISFEQIYDRIIQEMMYGAQYTVGAALSPSSEIIEQVENFEYEYPTYNSYDDEDADDDDCEDDDEDEDGEDDDTPPSGIYILHKIGG